MTNSPFAEIIESSLSIWRAQSWNWDIIPKFGSLITIETEKRIVFGIVYAIHTGSSDPARTVMAYQKTEQQLRLEQPQIFEFLQTTFSCLTLGYEQENLLLYQLAPEPPKIHASVRTASIDQTAHFFSNEQYLHLLFAFSQQIISLDELLLAILKQLSDTQLLTEKILTDFIDTFSLLTSNDYRRLKLFLQRAAPIIKLRNPALEEAI